MINTHNKRQGGFALLMTLLVVGVVITIGLTILDITIKQVRLSGNSKDSEVAFHSANSGLECGQYWRWQQSAIMELGNNLSPSCFGVTNTNVTAATVAITNGQYHFYQYEFSTTTSSGAMCSQVDTLIILSSLSSTSSISGTNMRAIIPGFPNTPKFCGPGGICTVMAARGYNRTCPSGSNPFPPGTIQREVLLEY